MRITFRGIFPYLFPLIFFAALIPVFQLSSLPPADFTFSNGTEPQSVDPAKSTGAPEGRIINAIFQGLYTKVPNPENTLDMLPVPGLASGHELSEDKLTYTFHIRPDANWSNGDPIVADDWVFSWMRFLHPESAAEYSYQLWYLKNGRKYTTNQLEEGDRVEIEVDRPDPTQLFPRGTIVSGILTKIDEHEVQDGNESKIHKVYTVDCVATKDGEIDWDGEKTTRSFRTEGVPESLAPKAEVVRNVLIHFSEVGVRAVDDKTLEVELAYPTPYFLDLVAFYPTYPVNRRCVEEYGFPDWTLPENIVTSGAYKIKFRRIRDRIRLVKNPDYWDADNVSLNVIDALAVQSETTQLNMYKSGQIDWALTVPNTVIPLLVDQDDKKLEDPERLGERRDLLINPMLTTYFYRVNVNRPPLDNPKVRQALNLAINKQEIVEFVTQGGQIPAQTVVPPGLGEYESPQTDDYNPDLARKLLAEAGYPNGEGMRPISILYNTNEGHKQIAEVIQQQWKRTLGIDIQLRNLEWGVYLTTVREMDYDVARAGWIADYPDPNTWLDMFVTDGENNQTGWSNPQYDELITQSGQEGDASKRLVMLNEAETILTDERPILPVYFYVSVNMVQPYVKHFYPNLEDLHPLHILEIDEELRDKIREREGLK